MDLKIFHLTHPFSDLPGYSFNSIFSVPVDCPVAPPNPPKRPPAKAAKEKKSKKKGAPPPPAEIQAVQPMILNGKPILI